MAILIFTYEPLPLPWPALSSPPWPAPAVPISTALVVQAISTGAAPFHRPTIQEQPASAGRLANNITIIALLLILLLLVSLHIHICHLLQTPDADEFSK